MKTRLILVEYLLRFADFIRSLPVVILRPKDMTDFSRSAYERHYHKKADNNEEESAGELVSDELWLWERIPSRKGEIIILGVGDGREAIFFGKYGLKTTGLDFCKKAVEKASLYMARRGLPFKGITGEISDIDLPKNAFDLAWISMYLYSVVLGRANRINMLKKINKSLKPQGTLACSFLWQPNIRHSYIAFLLRKLLAFITLGNLGFENGDIMFGTLEFRHAFDSEEELISEFTAGGFEVIHFTTFNNSNRGAAILRKRANY